MTNTLTQTLTPHTHTHTCSHVFHGILLFVVLGVLMILWLFVCACKCLNTATHNHHCNHYNNHYYYYYGKEIITETHTDIPSLQYTSNKCGIVKYPYLLIKALFLAKCILCFHFNRSLAFVVNIVADSRVRIVICVDLSLFFNVFVAFFLEQFV